MQFKPFLRLRNRKEDLDKYLEDIEFAYETSHQGHTPKNAPDITKHHNNTSCILFRQNLKGAAADWYIDLSKEAYKVESNKAVDKYMLLQQVANLAQGKDKSIIQYLRWAEELYQQLPDDTIGFNMVKGMKDLHQCERVTFECTKEQDYMFEKV
ncbi:MAG: hypothetical protein M1838_002172 [Thelocarpon superellum]|nr:MAG: hypothetical protein M1838_002172 [Thelocarpon superellum]